MPRVSVSFLAAPKGPVHRGHFFFSPPIPPLFNHLGVSFLATCSAEPQRWSREGGYKCTELSWIKKNIPWTSGTWWDMFFSKISLIIWAGTCQRV